MENQNPNPNHHLQTRRPSNNLSPLTVNSPLLHYIHSHSPSTPSPVRFPSRSPLMSIENIQNSRSPLMSIENMNVQSVNSRSPKPVFEVEEDVLVIDGIFLGGEMNRGKNRSGKGQGKKGESGGSGSSSGSSVSYSLKVAHGIAKEDLRPSWFPNKKKSEVKVCAFSSPGSCSHGAKCSFVHHLASESGSPINDKAVAKTKVPRDSPMKRENSSCSVNSFPVTNSDWCPLDDGIDITLPSAASTDKIPLRDAVKAHIDGVLYGPSRGKRLPVFAEICPE